MSNIIIKPPNDKSLYKHIKLKNNLEVVLIQDKDVTLSAASLTVNVGSYNNYDDYLGIAHFLEHMLFMGTKKYPEVSYFTDFISKNAGSRNAHTADEYTSYYYQILNKAFEESLDIFAQFFIDPLFKEDTLLKEMNAVDSEHAKNINTDPIRVERLINIASNTNHPSYKFTTGNLETLNKKNIRDTMIKFYKEFYRSDIMKLTVLSNIDLNKLEDIVIKLFSKINNNNNLNLTHKAHITPFTFDKNINLTNMLIKTTPINNNNILYIVWQTPSNRKYFRSKPLSYISNLLAHESDGSIIYNLKKLNLATQLSS